MTEQRNEGQETDGETTDSEPLSTLPDSYKIIGELSEADATGVVGRNSATAGTNYGVYGETKSTNDLAAGVLGESPGSGANGVMGLASVSTPTARSDPAGVYGEANNSPAYGIFGLNSASSGAYAEGVYGRTSSPDSPAITGENTNSDGVGVKSEGALEVQGHTSVSTVGCSAYLSTNFSVPDATPTIVPFDATMADDFGSFDTSTGMYTVQQAGDYHVDFLIDWNDTFSEGDSITYDLNINDSLIGGLSADTDIATSTDPSRCFNKALFGLSSGDTIEVEIYQDSGGSMDIFGNGTGETYLTIHKIG